jgi:3-hydroxyacyl-CoA dehydrogenase/enoyl-CoA hydratase/3-hydroxybutyryl-CoA epimerase
MIKKICVIGSGVMGAGITAHVTNSGYKVLMLDVVTENQNRNILTQKAIEKITESSDGIAHKKLLNLVENGNLEDDLEKIKDCDWVIEVIVENLDVKKKLYKKIEPFLKKGAFFSSNTSTFPLKQLKQDLLPDTKENFFITHFFNPPRHMRLLELVIDTENNVDKRRTLQDFIYHKLGRGVVVCNDTPGFIANRVGCFLLEHAIRCAIEFNIDIETIDNLAAKLFGFPKTGIFGLVDLIGLDVMGMIAKSLISLLPQDDRFSKIYYKVPQIENMIKNGYTGRKGQGGFYRILKDGNTKVKQVLDLNSWDYKNAAQTNETKFNTIADLVNDNSNIGMCFKKILVEFGVYVCSLIPEVCESPNEIDKAMRLGYNWKYGPFEIITMLDKFGFEYLIDNAYNFDIPLPTYLLDKRYSYYNNRLEQNKISNFDKLKSNDTPLIENSAAKLWQLKDDVLCLSLSTKMNILNAEVFEILNDSIKLAETKNLPIIIYNDLANFSFGADLKSLLSLKASGNSFKLENFIKAGQQAMLRTKYAKVPVISCSKGLALGGGCELLLHSTHVIANIETYAGLVEVGVGLIPGWGGLKESILRAQEDAERVVKNIKNILLQYKTPSAYQFEDFYGDNLQINMNLDLLLEEACSFAKRVIEDFKPNAKQEILNIPNFTIDKEFLDKIEDPHTKYIAKQLQSLSGLKSVSEEELLDFERNLFIELISTDAAEKKIRAVIKE